MRTILFTALLLPALASAVPAELTHTGRLLDGAGQPLTGTQTVTVALYAEAAGGSALWTDDFATLFDDGFFAVRLGAGAPLNAAALDADRLYVGIRVAGGTELSPRLPVTSVPFALRAGAVDGGSVNATEVIVGGQTVISATGTIDYGRITGAPADADTLAALGCSAGQVAAWNGAAWACSAAGASSFDASAIISGTLAYQRLPVGSSPDTIAPGDHTHPFGQITGDLPIDRTSGDLPITRTTGDLPIARTTGAVPFSRLPVGTNADQVAAGNHSHTAAQVGALPVGGGTLTGALTGTQASFSGSVQVGSSSATCNTGAAGALRFNAGALELCNGTAWQATGAPTIGTVPTLPGASCNDIKTRFAAAPSGVYWVDPNGGSTADAFQVYCDQVTDGGGWTLVQQNVPVVNSSIHLCQVGAIGALDHADNTANTPAKLANATINALWSSDRKLLIKYDADNTQPGSAVWDKVCIADFRSSYDWHTANNVSNFNNLDDTNLNCLVGTHATLNTVYTHPDMCGFGFSRGNADNYMIQAFGSGYAPSGSTCITTANAGRSWLGPGNNGCNMTKYFVR